MLRSLSLFSPDLVLVAVVITAVAAVRTRGLARTMFARAVTGKGAARLSKIPPLRPLVPAAGTVHPHPGDVLIAAGAAMTAIALSLAWAASYIPISTYLILALLGSGPFAVDLA